MFCYICDPFDGVCQFSFDKAKNSIDYKTGFDSAGITILEHMMPVMVSNSYRSKEKIKLNKCFNENKAKQKTTQNQNPNCHRDKMNLCSLNRITVKAVYWFINGL